MAPMSMPLSRQLPDVEQGLVRQWMQVGAILAHYKCIYTVCICTYIQHTELVQTSHDSPKCRCCATTELALLHR